jgi:hypothetical protein
MCWLKLQESLKALMSSFKPHVCLINLGRLLRKLNAIRYRSLITDTNHWYHPSTYYKLNQNLDRKNAHKDLVDVQEKIKAIKNRKA